MELPSSPSPNPGSSPASPRSDLERLATTPLTTTAPSSAPPPLVSSAIVSDAVTEKIFSPTLSPGIEAWTRLRQQLVDWLSAHNRVPTPAASGDKGLAAYLRPFTDESLEQILMRVLAHSGGEAKLLTALRDLPPEVALPLLRSALQFAQTNANQASTLPFLRLLLRTLEGSGPLPKALAQPGSSPSSQGVPPSAQPPSSLATALAQGTAKESFKEEIKVDHKADLGREAGRALTGHGRIIGKEWLGDLATGPVSDRDWGAPLLRLRLYDGQKSFSMLATEAPPLGTPVIYTLSQSLGQAGTSEANWRGHVTSTLPTGTSLPPSLESAYGLASPQGRLALGMAQDLLSELVDEPYFVRAVRDFAQVIEASGYLRDSASAYQPASKTELNALLKLWLDWPTTKANEALPSAWVRGFAHALRDPQSQMAALNLFKPAPSSLAEQQEALSGTSPGVTVNASQASQPSMAGQVLNAQMSLVPAHADARLALLKSFGESLAPAMDSGLTLEQWARLDAERARRFAGTLTDNSGGMSLSTSPLSILGLKENAIGSEAGEEALATSQSARLMHHTAANAVTGAPGGAPAPGVLHVLAFALRPDSLSAGPDASLPVFYYHDANWQRVLVDSDAQRRHEPQSEDKDSREGRNGKGRRGGSWQAQVDWSGDFLGQALACVKLLANDPAVDDTGQTIDRIDLVVEHEGPFAQDLLQAEIPRLEAALSMRGLALQNWLYRHQDPASLPPDPASPSTHSAHRIDLKF